MSMEITNNYGNYITGYANAAKKTGSTESKNEEEKGVKTSTVELKTSTHGVTKTAQIKTGFSNVNDYSKYLQEKYSYMNTGKTSMSGIPTTVTVSSAFLKKCMNDPEKAKYLEELREKRKDRDEYISEMSENSSSVVRAYTQAEYDNVDLLSTLDTKI